MRRIGGITQKYAWKRMQAGFLYAQRIKMNLTIRAAAKKCGIHFSTYEKAENGFPVSNAVARRIADGFDLTEEQALRLVMGYKQAEEQPKTED